MTDKTNNKAQFRVADLPQNRKTRFDLRPGAEALAAISRELDLLGLRKLRLAGEIRALGKSDWEVVATLGDQLFRLHVLQAETILEQRLQHLVGAGG